MDIGKNDAEEPIKPEDFLVYTDPNHGGAFLGKLYDLYTCSQLCNVKLQVGDDVLHAHKVVLASNSRYFEGELLMLFLFVCVALYCPYLHTYTVRRDAFSLVYSTFFLGMFLSNLMESHQNEVVIREIDFHILKCLIEFCYTSSVKIHSSSVLDLLSAANMLQFDGIKQCCSNYLAGKLDPHNCLSIAKYADLYTCDMLKETAITFSKKHFREVSQSEDFVKISFQQIQTLLQSDAISVTSEIEIFHALVTWIQHDESDRLKYFLDLFQLIRFLDVPPKLLGKI